MQTCPRLAAIIDSRSGSFMRIESNADASTTIVIGSPIQNHFQQNKNLGPKGQVSESSCRNLKAE